MRTLPRELAPGLFWLGECLGTMFRGRVYHGYNSSFVVAGEDASLLVEAGFPRDAATVDRQLDALAADGVPPIRYVFVTHQETPHASGLGRLLGRYPDALAIGDMSDYHLAFPRFADRLRWLRVGDEIDLGGTSFVAVEAVIRDLNTTLWGFDTRHRALFCGDGFAFAHFHDEGHCGCVAEEARNMDFPEMSALVTEYALHWTGYTEMEPWADRLDALMDELGVAYVCPTHGLPVTDVRGTGPLIREGLLATTGAR